MEQCFLVCLKKNITFLRRAFSNVNVNLVFFILYYSLLKANFSRNKKNSGLKIIFVAKLLSPTKPFFDFELSPQPK